MAEMIGCGITVLGNLLALVGAFSSQSAVNGLGIFFAIMNTSFAVLMFVGYGRDMKRTAIARNASKGAQKMDGLSSNPISRTRSDSARIAIGNSVEEAANEW